MLIVLKKIIKMGWQVFTRDGGVIIANIFILILTISLITSIFLVSKVSQFLITSLEEKMDISVYFKGEVQELQILDVKEELAQIPEVKTVKYLSKEEALQDFIQRHEEDPLLMRSLQEIGTNPFLASLSIKATDPTQYEKINNFLENPDFESLIEKVDYYQRKPIIERISSLIASAKKFGIGFSILLGSLSFLIVLNTIRLAILNSSEEIKIQRLVGASNWFIRGPFIVQGVIAGLFATFISLLMFTLICWFFSPKIEILFAELSLWRYFTNNFFIIILIQLATGISLGILSSTIAIRKYLKT